MTRLDFDHLVLVTDDVKRLCAFWERVLGASVHDLDAWQQGRAEYPHLHFGGWKINVHPADGDMEPRARHPIAGGGDVCLVWPGPIEDAVTRLDQRGVAIELGPIEQIGAQGSAMSVYFRDPDGNLVELLSYASIEGAN
jgi:catechol 2,3-dioxygenase-like lactoylglutathione lyase family enzyme